MIRRLLAELGVRLIQMSGVGYSISIYEPCCACGGSGLEVFDVGPLGSPPDAVFVETCGQCEGKGVCR